MTNLFSWLGRQLASLWAVISQGFSLLLVIFVAWSYLIYKALETATSMVIYCLSHIDTLVTYLNGQAAPPVPGTIGSILAIANTFFPLDELFQFTAAYLTLVMLPIGVYRFVKTWLFFGVGGANT